MCLSSLAGALTNSYTLAFGQSLMLNRRILQHYCPSSYVSALSNVVQNGGTSTSSKAAFIALPSQKDGRLSKYVTNDWIYSDYRGSGRPWW